MNLLCLTKRKVVSPDTQKNEINTFTSRKYLRFHYQNQTFQYWALFLCQDLVWAANLQKISAGCQAGLFLCRVPVPVKSTPSLQDHFMSTIGLLSTTEKQVRSGCLHMRPIQWHLKNWHIPDSLEKLIHIPNSLHPPLLWWLKEENALYLRPLYPHCHAIQIFHDASNKRWCTYLGDCTTKNIWSLPESKLHITFQELLSTGTDCLFNMGHVVIMFSRIYIIRIRVTFNLTGIMVMQFNNLQQSICDKSYHFYDL